MTTTAGNIRVVDITFHNARKQSAIEQELDESLIVKSEEVEAPVSRTPEQVKKFLKNVSLTCSNMETKKVYELVISWIDELLTLRRENIALKEKLEIRDRVNNE